MVFSTYLGNHALKKDIDNRITNCIIETPQTIKYELLPNDGGLVIKTGSVCYAPNGLDSGGNKIFNKVIISQDIMIPNDLSTDVILGIYSEGTDRYRTQPHLVFSGNEPEKVEYTAWYNTTTNKILRYLGGNWIDNTYSLPIMLLKYTEVGKNPIIEQVFNDFGFIGNVLFALPGVKLFMPNGRNEDGTLNNLEYTVSKPTVSEDIVGDIDYFLGFNSGGGFKRNQAYKGFYISDHFIKTSVQWCLLFNPVDNLYYNTGDYGETWTKYVVLAQIGTFTGKNNKISELNVWKPFQALDYNDTTYIASQSFPSERYIDLSLGATGNSYIAPADGYIKFVKVSTAPNQYVYLEGRLVAKCFVPDVATNATIVMPVKKGETFIAHYNCGGELRAFRFIYAEGEL